MRDLVIGASRLSVSELIKIAAAGASSLNILHPCGPEQSGRNTSRYQARVRRLS
jgi:hypothetical protein